ncbi:MFS transporter [Neobacillus notoginsengisoli]|uniref:MFS transporter n=1 Tax=Neobacillus notoginsengisoli TaxID=1578198 RepID=A0A417YWX2_9BACI|nr:MFS transporter [Neobacillus notoginsengisoli]RHW41741.1 MFS transporter [Neobacillus notoginsengisoli]
MWFSNFFVGGSMTMVMPFISLYIETFGNFSAAYVQHWAGIAFAATFVTAFLFSPFLGRLGDKVGRKRILIILGLGIACSLYLMGVVTTVWQLLALRLFMGFFAGMIPITQAFISTQTPKRMAGKVLGTLQTGSIAGTLLGPLAGGFLADTFGYAGTFKGTSVIILISVFLISMAREFKIGEMDEKSKYYSRRDVVRHIARNPALTTVLLISMFIQIALFSIQPILALFVSELNGPENLAFISGMAFSAAGVGNLLMARKWGELADRKGYLNILIILLLSGAFIYTFGSLVTAVWQLVLIRFGLGITIGGIIPVRMAYIRQEAPVAIQGEVLGYNTSLRFLGNIAGPIMGGFLAGSLGFSAVFLVTSALLFLSGFTLLTVTHKTRLFNSKVHS